MSKNIVGLDIGSWSVKALEIDPREGTIVAYHEVVLPSVEQGVGGDAPPPTGPGAPPAMPEEADAENFDDEPTQVREAPDGPDSGAEGESEEGEVVEPVGSEEAAETEPLDLEPWQAAFASLPNVESVTLAERLVTAMPEEMTTTLRVPVPFEERSKVRSVLPHLLDDRLPMPLDSVIWAFRIIPAVGRVEEGGEKFEAIVAVAAREDIGAHLAGLGEAGIDPSILLVPEQGLIALHRAGWRSDSGTVAFLDLGHETSNLLVVDDERPIVARSMKHGGRKLTDRIARAFDVDEAEAERIKHQYAAVVEGEAPNEQMFQLSEAVTEAMRPIVRDVRRTLQSTYARDQVEIETLFIVGGTSVIPGLDKHLSQQLGVEVERLIPDDLAGGGDAAARLSAAWSMAIVGSDDQLRAEAINLRTGEFVYRGRSSYLRGQIVKFAAAAAVLLILVLVLLMAQKASHEAQRDAMRAALRDQTMSLFGEPVTQESQIKARLEGEGGGAGKLIPTRSAYEITYEIIRQVSSDLDLDLTRLEVDVDRNVIQIRGDTSDVQAVDRLVTDLEKLECLKEIKKDKLTVRGDRADFELQISSGC